jgi:hypothetical protein
LFSGLRDYQDALVPFQETVTKADEVFVSQMAVGLDKNEAQKQLDTVRVRNIVMLSNYSRLTCQRIRELLSILFFRI